MVLSVRMFKPFKVLIKILRRLPEKSLAEPESLCRNTPQANSVQSAFSQRGPSGNRRGSLLESAANGAYKEKVDYGITQRRDRTLPGRAPQRRARHHPQRRLAAVESHVV